MGIGFGVSEKGPAAANRILVKPARAVIECFKHRNSVGLDVALEAMRDLIKRRRGRTDQLWRTAGVFRMQNVMRPYLEASA